MTTLSKLAFGLAILILSSSVHASSPAEMTDEAVYAALAKSRKGSFEAKNFCLARVSGLSGVVLVGEFGHDKGCVPRLVFVDGKQRALDSLEKFTPTALGRMGWKTAAPAERGAIALAWLREGIYAFEGKLVNESPTEAVELRAGKKAFTGAITAPKVTATIDAVTIDAWATLSPGSMCDPKYGQAVYSARRFVFTHNAAVRIDNTAQMTVSAPCFGAKTWEP